MGKKGSPIYEAKTRLEKMAAYGQSKHQDRLNGISTKDKIYSYGTMKTYQRESLKFVRWCRENHPETRGLDAMRGHVDDYLTHIINAGWKPASISTAAASLAKLYGCSVTDFRDRPRVTRASITKGRGEGKEGHISPAERARLEAVTQSFMLRNCDLRQLRPEWLHRDDKGIRLDIPIRVSKGGKPRSVYAHTPNTEAGRQRLERAVRTIENTLPGNKVFSKVNSHYYAHPDRAAGCRERYEEYTREVMERNKGIIPSNDRYIMRNSYDKGGNSDGLGSTVLCRSALRRCGEELGHGPHRESLVANHYLYLRGGD